MKPMTFDVVLLKQPENGYIARPLLWPDVAARGATEEEALERVRSLIRDLLMRTQIVQVEVNALDDQTENPWITKAGLFADDPDWDEFLEEMALYRGELDAHEALESV